MIRYADGRDLAVLKEHERHLPEAELESCVRAGRVLVLYADDRFAGWLRYGLFWDQIPFLNMLYVLEGERNRGYGTALISFWEQEMARADYPQVLTSTQADERAQFFYRKRGYRECGALILPEEPLEMFFLKTLEASAGKREKG